MMDKPAAKKDNKFVKYLRGIKSEMKKIAWPARKQVVHNTLIVLACVIVFGVIIAALDAIFNYGIISWFTK